MYLRSSKLQRTKMCHTRVDNCYALAVTCKMFLMYVTSKRNLRCICCIILYTLCYVVHVPAIFTIGFRNL